MALDAAVTKQDEPREDCTAQSKDWFFDGGDWGAICSNWWTQPRQGHWPLQPALPKRPHPTSPPPPALRGRRSLQNDSSPPSELHIGQPSLRPVETARLSNRLRSLGSSYSAAARRLNKSGKPQRPQPTAQIRNTLSTKMRKIRRPCETPQIKDPFLCGCKIRNHRGSQKIVTTSLAKTSQNRAGESDFEQQQRPVPIKLATI